jgi:protein tyrosine/serine phosphatase
MRKLFSQNLTGKAENWFKSILRRRNYYLIKFEDLKEEFESFLSPLEDKNIVSYERLRSCK